MGKKLSLAALFLLAIFSFSSCENKGQKPEAEIQTIAKEYNEAYNRGDVKGISAFWVEDGVFTNPRTGQKFTGKEEIESHLEEIFKTDKRPHLVTKIHSITFPTPDEAIEIGSAEITRDGTPLPHGSNYEAHYIKKNGKWMITQIKEADSLDRPNK